MSTTFIRPFSALTIRPPFASEPYDYEEECEHAKPVLVEQFKDYHTVECPKCGKGEVYDGEFEG